MLNENQMKAVDELINNCIEMRARRMETPTIFISFQEGNEKPNLVPFIFGELSGDEGAFSKHGIWTRKGKVLRNMTYKAIMLSYLLTTLNISTLKREHYFRMISQSLRAASGGLSIKNFGNRILRPGKNNPSTIVGLLSDGYYYEPVEEHKDTLGSEIHFRPDRRKSEVLMLSMRRRDGRTGDIFQRYSSLNGTILLGDKLLFIDNSASEFDGIIPDVLKEYPFELEGLDKQEFEAKIQRVLSKQ